MDTDTAIGPNVQGDQLNMTVFFWYLVKIDFSNVDTFYKLPKKHGYI